MSAELASILLQFQPEAPELKQRREYDQAARSFVSQLSNISASHWLKGLDTPQEILPVSSLNAVRIRLTDCVDSQPCSQLHRVRIRASPPHHRHRRQEDRTRFITAGRCIVEQSGAFLGDGRPCSVAICWARMEEISRIHRTDCTDGWSGMLHMESRNLRTRADEYSLVLLLHQYGLPWSGWILPQVPLRQHT